MERKTCPACGADNAAAAGVCMACGEYLEVICPRCGSSNASGNNFCGACGFALRETFGSPRDERPADAEDAERHAERRQLSVMFCDLVGSTELARTMDPEDVREVVQQYQEVCVRCIGDYQGYVAQYLGDGILAYFGYPIAHEESAEWAIKAGLEIIQGIKELDRRLRAERALELAVRVGIDTGVVVIGEVGSGTRREHLAIGDAPNMAARIQSVAPRNTLVISETTQRLVAEAFEWIDLGPHHLKGIDGAEHLFRVVQERMDIGPLDVVGLREPAIAIGREDELERMHAVWRSIELGGAVVAIRGEPGIGKSHLVRAFRQRLAHPQYSSLLTRCSPNHTSSPYYPIVDMLQRMLNFYPDQPMDERREMLDFVLNRLEIDFPEAQPMLASLLGLPVTDVDAPAPAHYRVRLHELLAVLIERISHDRPMLLVVEDIHWIDPSTLEFLQRFGERIRSYRVMLVLTFRPHILVAWPADAPVHEIHVERLPRHHVLNMVASVAGQPLPEDLVNQIIDKTDGVPLFVRELTRMVVDSGLHLSAEAEDAAEPLLAIPSTLHDSLMARLDQLLPVKEVAQACSVLGREFSYDAIRATARLSDAALQGALERLVEADLLLTDGAPPRNQYVFRHALIQEAAYGSMLRSKRQQYHRRIAHHLGAQAPEWWEPDVIALHHARGGQPDEAAQFWYVAGQRAQARSANAEAEQHFRSGLEALQSLPSTAERRSVELLLYAGLGGAALQVKGYAHSDVRSAFERASLLARGSPDVATMLPLLRGLLSHNMVMGRHEEAAALAEQIAVIGEKTGERAHIVEGWRVAAGTAVWRGDVRKAQLLFGRVLDEMGDAVEVPPSPLFEYPAVGVRSYLSVVQWYLGSAGEAMRLGSEALEIARSTGHPFSLAFALGFGSLLNSYLGRRERCHELAAELITLGRARDFAFWTDAGLFIHAWAEAGQDPEGAVVRMKQAIDRLESGGVAMWMSFPRALLAEALGDLGRPIEGLAVVEKGLQAALQNDELYYAPELYRVSGDLLRADEPSRAEARFEEGLRIAVEQQARPLVLRLLMSMMKLDGEAPRREERLQMMREWTGAATDDVLPEAATVRALLQSLEKHEDAETPEGRTRRPERSAPRPT